MGLLPPPPPDDEDRSRFPGGAGRPDPSPAASFPSDSRYASRRTDLRVVVPDDLRSLDAEVRAVQAELGVELPPEPPLRRGQRFVAWFRGRAHPRSGMSRVEPGWPPPRGLGRVLLVGPVVALTLLVVAALAALVPDGDPSTARRSVEPPRLATPSAAPGEVGGLVPDVVLGGPAGAVPARDLRPGVLMLVPDGCACPQLVHQVIGQVEEYPGLEAALVGSGDPGVAALAGAREGGGNRLPALTDDRSVLARTYHGGPAGSVPTLLFVAADGRLTAPPLVFTPGTRIESSLLPLLPLRA